MKPPLDSINSADWLVYADFCREQADRGESPPRPPFIIRQIAEVLAWYERREEEPLLYLAPGPAGAATVRWLQGPPDEWGARWCLGAPPSGAADPPQESQMTNPARRPHIAINWPGAAWDFFAVLLFAAISGRKA